MPDHALPDEHHFARQCSGFQGRDFSQEDEGYHQPPWLHGIKFQPDLNNPNISGLWVERLPGSWRQQLERIRDELKSSTRKVSKNANLAILSVVTIRTLGRRYDRDLHVLHTPDDENGLPSHSEIRGIRPEDGLL